MRQVLETLMALQDVDSELQKLESLKGDLPQQIVHLKSELTEMRQQFESEKEKIDLYQKEKTKSKPSRGSNKSINPSSSR